MDFIDYCLSFYGKGQIYDMGATKKDLKAALKLRMAQCEIPFEGDSIDRELVRDFLPLANPGKKFTWKGKQI
jgi:hypothetical protein